VPVMYSLLDDLGDFFARHYTHAGDQPAEGEGEGPRPRRRRVRELVARFQRPTGPPAADPSMN
jgi:hypothetical protein